MASEAIILAGGLGTRLRSVVSELPKAMAPIGGRPFLTYILNYLAKQGIEHVVLSLGFKSEAIVNYFGQSYNGMRLSYALEEQPLGTGGGMMKALKLCQDNVVLALNGDTLFPISLERLSALHRQTNATLTLALKTMHEFDRYGSVVMDGNRVTGFREKQHLKKGIINGGCYLINREELLGISLPEKFSWEKDLLEKYFDQYYFAGLVDNSYFIDIGIPEDYRKAQDDLEELGF